MRDASPGAFLLQKNTNYETSGWTWKSGADVFCVQKQIIRKEDEKWILKPLRKSLQTV